MQLMAEHFFQPGVYSQLEDCLTRLDWAVLQLCALGGSNGRT